MFFFITMQSENTIFGLFFDGGRAQSAHKSLSHSHALSTYVRFSHLNAFFFFFGRAVIINF